MIRLTKEELYKLERTQKAIRGQRYEVDGDIYEGNPYGRVRFISKGSSASIDVKVNGQTLNKDIVIPIPLPINDDSANYVEGEYIAGTTISSPIAVALIGNEIFPFDITDENHYGKLIGVSLTAGLAGTTIIVALQGEAETGSIIFTEGETYFIGATSYLTNIAPTVGIYQIVAVAKTTSKILINIQQPIIQI